MVVLTKKIALSLLTPVAMLIAPQVVSAQGEVVFPGGAKIEWGGHPAHRYEPNNAANRGNHQIEKQLNHLDKLSEGGFTMNTGGKICHQVKWTIADAHTVNNGYGGHRLNREQTVRLRRYARRCNFFF
ncbi:MULTISPECIES: hypothetical protein [unclassified Prochlorococcus]|uniref:hypothetical protein n=1 Tax=unclassified Prochlorococcus TaxID=2627481 RepID=UPI0005339864|nr:MULTISPECIES: hypothetical protein [unclassified Prochlorococcus]KGG26783.1 hypothetical protein EV12_1564 [Prochlorococcus sp. MIT 0701]KGG28256.1 hypothetical protein EV13_1669 [Prochlorococcus sp. MIT 0702]KGG31473.1 hypothetical protein EV14_2265 [Prochlorococcus sp. MIT 0703]